jgi:hypothetical protein
LSLDIFGYQLSHSNAKTIQIHRPEWMNAIPLSLICPANGESTSQTLQVPIKSIHNGNHKEAKEGSYYSSHLEESYKLNIQSQFGDGHSTRRKSGVTFISNPWRDTADRVVNYIQSASTSIDTDAAAANLPSPSNTTER